MSVRKVMYLQENASLKAISLNPCACKIFFPLTFTQSLAPVLSLCKFFIGINMIIDSHDKCQVSFSVFMVELTQRAIQKLNLNQRYFKRGCLSNAQLHKLTLE